MQHFIRKHIFELSIRNEEEAFALQQEISRLFWQNLSPKMETLFDTLSNPAETIRIERLEIDLGQWRTDRLAGPEFAESLLQKLETALVQRIAAPEMTDSITPHAGSHFEQWLQLLETGALPWMHSIPKPEAFRDLPDSLARNIVYKNALQNSLRKYPDVLQRLLSQYDTVFLTELAAVFVEKPVSNVKTAVSIFHAIAVGDTPTDMPDTDSPKTKAGRKKDKKHRSEEKGAGKETSRPEPVKLPEKAEYLVFNAGLVLLNPFIARLFEHAGLVEKNEFKDFQGREKAVQLLHYLATGVQEAQEYELLLPKILCGLAPEMPVETKGEISTAEQQFAADLLQAAVNHWGALGKVSGAALQEGFIQRQGKLSRRQGDWLLQLEPHGIDILLDTLPWTLGMIKLPWMPELLRVEWRL